MKKIFAAALIFSTLLLSGCFGFFEKKTPQKPAAGEVEQDSAAPTPAKNGQTSIPEPPSFQDGDYYLQAVAARSLTTCESIKNERLQAKCKVDVEAILKQQQQQ